MPKRVTTDAEEVVLDQYVYDVDFDDITTFEWEVETVNGSSAAQQKPSWIVLLETKDADDNTKTSVSLILKPYEARSQNVDMFTFRLEINAADGSTFSRNSSVILRDLEENRVKDWSLISIPILAKFMPTILDKTLDQDASYRLVSQFDLANLGINIGMTDYNTTGSDYDLMSKFELADYYFNIGVIEKDAGTSVNLVDPTTFTDTPVGF